ncbi:MAG: 3-oxoacyl-ACP reductase [Phototrophicales bacterium]|nr:MAG: 3-oxoacyl-ACP reductase [Phototrophicales bacterium]
MSNRFENQVIMVTGASGNVGRSMVQHFHNEGGKIVLVEHRQERLDEITEALDLDPATCQGFTADVTDAESVNQLVMQAVEHFGKIDILVHTVGGYAAGQPVHEAGVDVWDRMMALNAKSVYIVAGRVAKYMVERGTGGKIITILARNAEQGTANAGAYSASKAAAQRIIESMAAELRTIGINVNAIMPSNIDTPQNRAAMPDADYETWVTAEDIAHTAMFLASQQANAINGASVPVYGCT